MPGRRHTSFFGLAVSQGVGDVAQTGPVEIVAVSSGLYDVTGSEPLQPDAALLLGPCKVVPEEWPTLAAEALTWRSVMT